MTPDLRYMINRRDRRFNLHYQYGQGRQYGPQ